MNIFKLEFKSTFKSLLIWLGIVSLILILFMSFFPSMGSAEMKDLVNAKLSALPEGFLKALGIDNVPDFSDIAQYYAYIVQYVALAVAIYAALLGASVLAKEETDGTIEYLYAQPVTRVQIVLYKLLASLFSFFLLIVGITIVSSLFFLIFKPADADLIVSITEMKTIISGFLFSGMIFLCIGFLVSTLIRSAKQATPVSMGIVFGTYILGMFSKTFADKVEAAKYLKYFSPLDYGMPMDILKNGFDGGLILLGMAIAAICIAFTFVVYNKKDLRI